MLLALSCLLIVCSVSDNIAKYLAAPGALSYPLYATQNRACTRKMQHWVFEIVNLFLDGSYRILDSQNFKMRESVSP